MSKRPRLQPALWAELSEAAPRRLIKKLDKAPTQAEDWSWEETPDGSWTVRTPREEQVGLRPQEGVLRSREDLSCTCLLAPRCLHLLATLSVLELAEDGPGEPAAGEPAGAEPSTPAPAAVLVLSPAQREAAARLWRVGSELLDGGALAAGAVAQAELLRAQHACRACGLHRLSSAALRVVRGIRDLRAERPAFRLSVLHADLEDLLGTAWQLLREDAPPAAEWLGVARRAYAPQGNLRLWGLYAEAIVARSGYAGVVTYLVDADGRVWTVADVMPGGLGRVEGSYGKGVGTGGVTASPRELARSGLILQDATGSAQGRLGSGQGVRAVAAGASTWSDDGPAGLFAAERSAQLARAYAAARTPELERRAGSLLVFLEGRVLGADADSLWLALAARPGAEPELPVRGLIPPGHAPLATGANLRVLAHAPGVRLRCIARVLPARPRTLALLAVGPAPDPEEEAPALELPAAWQGRCNLALDALQRSYLRGAEREPRRFGLNEARSPDPFNPLRRRLSRLVLGGRATLPPEALDALRREEAALQRRLCPSGAHVLGELTRVALSAERGVDGTRRRADAPALARAWLAACGYQRAASEALQLQAW